MGRVGRNYEIIIQNPTNQTLKIGMPFTTHFDMNRDTMASMNHCTLDIYELGQQTRNFLYKDKYTFNQYWKMKVNIGYGYNLFNVFLGNILECFSYKDGPHWITHIEGLDGLFGLQNNDVHMTIPANSQRPNILMAVIKGFTSLTPGVMGAPAQGSYSKSRSYAGSPQDFLNSETGGQYFIDKETIHIKGSDEAINYPIPVLSSDYIRTTPKRRETMLEVDMNMTPELEVGGMALLQSLFTIYNGEYECLGVKHNGVISEAESGDFVTTAQLYAGARAFKILNMAGPQ